MIDSDSSPPSPVPIDGKAEWRKPRRLEIVKKGLLEGKMIAEIAEEMGVSEPTVYRLLRKWRESGGFEEWLHEEWVRSYGEVRQIDPTVSFRELSGLLGKHIRQKMDVDASVTGTTVIVQGWDMGRRGAADEKPTAAGRKQDPPPEV